IQIGKRRVADLYSPLDIVRARLTERASSIRQMTQGHLGHPMSAYRLPSGLDVVLKDHRDGAWYAAICHGCSHYPCHDALMAIRLTPDARLQFCLLRDDITVPLTTATTTSDSDLTRVISDALDVYASAEFAKEEALA